MGVEGGRGRGQKQKKGRWELGIGNNFCFFSYFFSYAHEKGAEGGGVWVEDEKSSHSMGWNGTGGGEPIGRWLELSSIGGRNIAN